MNDDSDSDVLDSLWIRRGSGGREFRLGPDQSLGVPGSDSDVLDGPLDQTDSLEDENRTIWTAFELDSDADLFSRFG